MTGQTGNGEPNLAAYASRPIPGRKILSDNGHPGGFPKSHNIGYQRVFPLRNALNARGDSASIFIPEVIEFSGTPHFLLK